MKKPWWVRLTGWLFWLGLAWIAMVVWGATHVPGGVLLLMGFWIYVTFVLGCLLVWMIGSLVAWAVHKQGRQQAAILRELLAVKPEAAPSAAGHIPLKQSAAPPRSGALRCQACGRAASSFCTAHGVPVCEAHLNAHDTPQCSYVPSQRVQVVSAVPPQSERKAPRSVLGLG